MTDRCARNILLYRYFLENNIAKNFIGHLIFSNMLVSIYSENLEFINICTGIHYLFTSISIRKNNSFRY